MGARIVGSLLRTPISSFLFFSSFSEYLFLFRSDIIKAIDKNIAQVDTACSIFTFGYGVGHEENMLRYHCHLIFPFLLFINAFAGKSQRRERGCITILRSLMVRKITREYTRKLTFEMKIYQKALETVLAAYFQLQLKILSLKLT